MSGLGAQAAHALFGVISRKCCEIHAGNGTQQPCRLPVFFYRTASCMTLRPTFDGAGVHSNLLHPVEVEGDAAIRNQRTPGKSSDGIGRLRVWETIHNFVACSMLGCHGWSPRKAQSLIASILMHRCLDTSMSC